MGRQVQGLSGEEPTFAPPRIPPENSKAATDRSELAAGTLIQSLKRRQGAVRSGCRASVTCSTNADLAPARCLPSGSTKPLLPGEPAFPPDRHFRRTLRVIGVVTSCRYRCGRCGSWPPVLRFSPSPTLLPPSLSLPRRRSVVRRRLPDPSLTPFWPQGHRTGLFPFPGSTPESGRGPWGGGGGATEERKDQTTLGSPAGSHGSQPPWQWGRRRSPARATRGPWWIWPSVASRLTATSWSALAKVSRAADRAPDGWDWAERDWGRHSPLPSGLRLSQPLRLGPTVGWWGEE